MIITRDLSVIRKITIIGVNLKVVLLKHNIDDRNTPSTTCSPNPRFLSYRLNTVGGSKFRLPIPSQKLLEQLYECEKARTLDDIF